MILESVVGLRFVAVASVILYHFVESHFPSGFVGVDVFFCISGYVLSMSLDRKVFGAKDLLPFYRRRILRVYPVLVVYVFVVLIVGYIFIPGYVSSFSLNSMFASLVMASNFYYMATADYFNYQSKISPLIHTWSLAVEFQFYLLFPLLFKFAKKKRISIEKAVALASLASFIIVGIRNQDLAFYSPFTRCWEFLLGSIAFYSSGIKNKRSSGYVAGGCTLLLAVLPFVPSNNNLLMSGVAAFTAFFLLSNIKSAPRILKSKIAIFFGTISYSLYIWHQGVYSAQLYIEPATSILLQVGSGLGITFLLSIASYGLIEKKWRYSQSAVHKYPVCIWLLLSCILMIAIGCVKKSGASIVKNIEVVQRYENYHIKEMQGYGPCHLMKNGYLGELNKTCINSDIGTLLWGDSLAGSLSYGLNNAGVKFNQITSGSCPPIIDFESDNKDCVKLNRIALESINEKTNYVILGGYWYEYYNQSFVENLKRTISEILKKSPRASILIVGQFPVWKPTLPLLVSQRHLDLLRDKQTANSEINSLREIDRRMMESVGDGIIYQDIISRLCNSDACYYSDGAELYVWDSIHLTKAGSIAYARLLKERLSK